jgi:hypothetical protein
MNGKFSLFISIAMLVTFVAVTILIGVMRDIESIGNIKKAFQWFTVYGVPWISLFILILILRAVKRK